MSITLSGRYALKVMVYIALRRGRTPVTVQRLSKKLNIPKSSLVGLLHDLSSYGLIRILPGPQGGVVNECHSEQFSLRDIVRAVRGALPSGECFFRKGTCSPCEKCPVHEICERINQGSLEALEQYTLGDICGKIIARKVVDRLLKKVLKKTVAEEARL